MDMADMAAELASLKLKNSRLESDNYRMKSEIKEMEDSVRSVNKTVSGIKDSTIGLLSKGEYTISGDDNILLKVSLTQDNVKGMMTRYKNMERAHKTIRELNNQLRYHQDGEANVRKMLIAIMNNEVNKLASEDVIKEQVEKQYLQTQYFFLSYIMMDLIHTKAGKKEAAERARKKAFELDERRSTWTYFLIALRFNDKKKLLEMTDKLIQTPLIGSEELFVKLLTVIALCDTGEVAEKIRAYVGLDNIAADYKPEIVGDIYSNYFDLIKVNPPEFKHIDKHVVKSENLMTALTGAMNNEAIFNYIQKIAGGSSSQSRSQFYSDVFDEAMEYCRSPKSDEISKQIADQEKIIKAEGVESRAMELQVEEELRLASDLNVENCLYHWLSEGDDFAGKETITEFSYEKFKPCYKRAYTNYVNGYRGNYQEKLSVKIEDYKTITSFKDIDADYRDMDKFLTERCAQSKSEIKDTKFYLFTIFGALLIIAGIVLNFLTFAIPSPFNTILLVVCVVAGLTLVILGLKVKYANYQNKNKLDEKLEEDRLKYNEALHAVYSEMQTYREMYEQYDAKAIDESQF